MKFDLGDKKLVSTIGEVLSGYSGKSPVIVQHNGKLYDLKMFVEPSTSLKAEIADIIGESNIKII